MSRIVDEAIAAGKFSERRRQHYEQMYAARPAETARLIASLHAVPQFAEPPAPSGGLVLAGGFYDETRTVIEFQDTEVAPGGVRPALRAWPRPAEDPYVVEPLPWFASRPHKRITMGD